jgi:hypothetical protein
MQTTSLLLQAPTTPFQLSANGRSSRDRCQGGAVHSEGGDVVVVGTDGIFVNIIEEQLELAV